LKSRSDYEKILFVDDKHYAEAEHWILKAIEADQRNGTRFHLGRDYALYSKLHKRKGDSSPRNNLGKSIEILEECGADGWVEKYESELATM